MIESPRPRIDCQEDGDRYGRFVVEPLERGYGITLGNSLRRILLSSLPGAAIASVRIDGVLHEFSTIPGVYEDVTDIILNLKSLLVKLHGDTPRVVRLNAEGPGDVTAADFEADAEVEILNPELHIATLGTVEQVNPAIGRQEETGARLSLEALVEPGRGYMPAEKNKRPDHGFSAVASRVSEDSSQSAPQRTSLRQGKSRVPPVLYMAHISHVRAELPSPYQPSMIPSSRW